MVRTGSVHPIQDAHRWRSAAYFTSSNTRRCSARRPRISLRNTTITAVRNLCFVRVARICSSPSGCPRAGASAAVQPTSLVSHGRLLAGAADASFRSTSGRRARQWECHAPIWQAVRGGLGVFSVHPYPRSLAAPPGSMSARSNAAVQPAWRTGLHIGLKPPAPRPVVGSTVLAAKRARAAPVSKDRRHGRARCCSSP